MKIKNIRQFFTLSARKIFVIALLWIATVIIHNLIYAISGIEEAVFFTIAFPVIPLYLVISFAYTMCCIFKKKEKQKKSRKK